MLQEANNLDEGTLKNLIRQLTLKENYISEVLLKNMHEKCKFPNRQYCTR